MNRNKILLTVLFFLIMINSNLLAQDNFHLSVVVTGAQPNKGKIVLSVFNSEEAYLKDSFLNKTSDVGENGTIQFELHDLKPGVYAISVFYDEDSNGELKTGFMGIPKEKVGFSNNIKGTFGPPPFSKTSFELSHAQSIQINLGKAKN